jgi:hypothetical protein
MKIFLYKRSKLLFFLYLLFVWRIDKCLYGMWQRQGAFLHNVGVMILYHSACITYLLQSLVIKMSNLMVYNQLNAHLTNHQEFLA